MGDNKKTNAQTATDEAARADGTIEQPAPNDTETAQGGPPASADEGSELDSLRKELAEAQDRFLRAKAEQQNIQKRAAQERVEVVRYAHAAFVRDLLGTIDDFERTLSHGAGTDVQSVLDGLQLVHDNFLKVLKDHHVEVIEPRGAAFDPRLHEAMLQKPVEDQAPGTVVEVVQRGYRLHDRVLRPAKVIIAAAPESAAPPPASNAESETVAPQDPSAKE